MEPRKKRKYRKLAREVWVRTHDGSAAKIGTVSAETDIEAIHAVVRYDDTYSPTKGTIAMGKLFVVRSYYV